MSPLSFTPGTLTQEESGINADFVKSFKDSPVNIAFGGELRNETYKIEAGDPSPSWPVRRRRYSASVPTGSRASRLIGRRFRERQLGGLYRRRNRSDDRLSGAIALRYEDYDEFGDTTDWKVSGRYQFTDALRDPSHCEHGLPRADARAGQ